MTPEKSTGWQGILRLKYAKDNNSTKLIEAYSQAPLKIQRSFYPEGKDICHNVILHTAGGIVGGDRLLQEIHLQPKTQAVITTASASKIYRSSGKQAKQTVKIKVDENACCEYLPRETIVFNGAIYRQDLQVELAQNASWLGWEITRFGRTARGEKYTQGEWRSCTEIWQNGKPLWIDRQWLPASEEILTSPHGLAGQAIVGTLAWVGHSVSEEMLKEIRQLWNHPDTLGEVGVTQLLSGFLCRYRGNTTQEVINWFTTVWQYIRQNHQGRVITQPRVWKI